MRSRYQVREETMKISVQLAVLLCAMFPVFVVSSTYSRGNDTVNADKYVYRRKHLGPIVFEKPNKPIEKGNFPKPPRPQSRLNLIPRISRTRSIYCTRLAKRFAKKYGFFSKGQHACCLFGADSGFCGKDFIRGRVCNDAPYKTDKNGVIESRPEDRKGRNVWAKHIVNGRCCIRENEERGKGEPALRMDCVEDQTTDSCGGTCSKMDRRCEEARGKMCLCNYNKIWDYQPEYRAVSKYLDAGTAIFGDSCYMQDPGPLKSGMLFCCGLPMAGNVCGYWKRLCMPLPKRT